MSFSYLQVVAATQNSSSSTNNNPSPTTSYPSNTSDSSGKTIVFVSSDQQKPARHETYETTPATQPHSQHIQQTRYTEQELDFHQTSKAVFLTNLPRHLDREAIFKILSQITQREVKKFDLPSQQKIRDEYNKGFAYLHLKTPYRTRQLLNKKFLRIGGNKVLIHPYRDHRGPVVLPKKVDLSSFPDKQQQQQHQTRRNDSNRYEEHDHERSSNKQRGFRSRFPTADSGIKINPGTPSPNTPRPDEQAVFSPPEKQSTPTPSEHNNFEPEAPCQPIRTIKTQCRCSDVKSTCSRVLTPATSETYDNGEEMKNLFIQLTPLQRCLYYDQYSLERHNSHDFQVKVEKYLLKFAKIAKDQYRWARYLQQFAETNGMEFSYVTETLMRHKQQSHSTYHT